MPPRVGAQAAGALEAGARSGRCWPGSSSVRPGPAGPLTDVAMLPGRSSRSISVSCILPSSGQDAQRPLSAALRLPLQYHIRDLKLQGHSYTQGDLLTHQRWRVDGPAQEALAFSALSSVDVLCS